jgi:predicted nucleic acid-binding protein
LPSNPTDLIARHNSSTWTRTLAYRPRSKLPFDVSMIRAGIPVMLDTTIYIDALKPLGLPGPVAALIARNVVLHCAIACAELAVSIGHLDPAHPRTAEHRVPLIETLSRMAPARIIAPSADAWTEAALIAGILARTQGYARDGRRAVLNDALMLLTAIEAGAVLVSRNVRDMDLLLRFRPDGQLLLYGRNSVY